MGSKEINVGIGDYAVIKCPGKIMSTALGSCVAIILYDKHNQIGALAHIMLPMAPPDQEITRPGKYANTAVKIMLEEMKKLGANRLSRIQAKLVGGAHMFKSNPNNGKSIGNRNVECSRDALKEIKIKVENEETGGITARNVCIDTTTGVVEVSTANGEKLEI